MVRNLFPRKIREISKKIKKELEDMTAGVC